MVEELSKLKPNNPNALKERRSLTKRFKGGVCLHSGLRIQTAIELRISSGTHAVPRVDEKWREVTRSDEK